MIIKKAACIPLVLHDPYFSIWSNADHLYDKDTVHWSGKRQQLRGYVTVDGKVYCFLGNKDFHNFIPQTSVDITATATKYTFENEDLKLTCTFTSPLLPKDMVLVSRPCTYIDFDIEKKNAKEVSLHFEVSADLVRIKKDEVMGFAGTYNPAQKETRFSYSYMGRAMQQPLSSSGDFCTIDWGYAYLASKDSAAKVAFDLAGEKLTLDTTFSPCSDHTDLILAYDDILSINYFGEWRKAYWTQTYATILEAISAAFSDKEAVLKKAAALDEKIEQKAMEIGGTGYAFLCNMSFRQTIAAHKLITNEKGELIFFSKEHGSGGVIGTVDVSYPSMPLFLLFDTEYIKAMLRPIFDFAAREVWEYDFAPHDVGRYPYAWGQMYGVNRQHKCNIYAYRSLHVYPPFYMYPAGSEVYDFEFQMPVEECGNMLIMVAAICMQDNTPEFARPHWDVLTQWKEYLIRYGADPGNQLCTDDFAGHLAHNVNLSVKAIMGIEAYAKLAEMLGDTESAANHHQLAREMASDWEKRAFAGDHYTLSFGDSESWSLKYNLIWDKLWNCRLFSEEVYEKELAYYEKKTDTYGTPLDSRSAFTKSDWILWCAAMTDDREQAIRLISPIVNFLENSKSRVPFSDLYMADTGLHRDFTARSVQGGIFMPMLKNGF